MPPISPVVGWTLQDLAKIDASGEAISQTGFAARGWYKATVPGTVLTTLVDNGIYPEPLYGENNRPDKIPESLCRTSYCYRTETAIPREFAGRRVWLNFDGINYAAEVWVNGRHIGDIRGAFARGIFDLTSVVEPGHAAAIAVLIRPPPHPANPEEQTLAAGTGGNGGVFSKDGPTFIATQGWDWMPAIRDRDMGIWQKVWLNATGPVVIENPLVTSALPLPRIDAADLTIEATVRNVTTAPQHGVLSGGFDRVSFSVAVSLAPGESQKIKLTPQTTPALHIAQPRLWWPNGYGVPNLYALRLSFAVGDTLSDACTFNFGIRQISYQVPGSENLTVSINGVPVMCRGGDWGMDEAMKRIPRDRLEAQIRFHRLARCNMIRNWVGQSTGEDFYDLCDRYGIMVWDEFFQPNPSDSGRTQRDDGSEDVHDVPLYLANVREKVLRFRHHACIVLWCGRNEGDPAPAAVADGLKQIMTELEPVRLYHPNSNDGRGVRSGGPYAWRTPREYFLSRPSRNPSAPPPRPEDLEPFKTEIGSVSIPTLESVQAMMPARDWDTINDDWAEHDLCRGAQAGDRYVEMLKQRYGEWAGLAGFVREAQLANYEAHRAMFEGRFARLFAPCTGVLAWMSNPAQPSFVWQFYSYDLEPLAALFAVRKACEAVHVLLNQTDSHVAVVNQTPTALDGLTVRARIVDLDGATKGDRTFAGGARGSAASDLGTLELPADVSPVHFVKLELRDAKGRLLSDNFYWQASVAAPNDFRALNKLPMVTLEADVVRRSNAAATGDMAVDDLHAVSDVNRCRFDVTLTNRSAAVALLAHLQLRRGRSNVRVLPVYYDDNYVSLLPGESRTVGVVAAANDLAGEPALIVVDGWNVTVRPQTFDGGVKIAPNAAAIVSK